MHIVHQLSEARAAIQAGVSDIISPDNAAPIAGVGYWQAIAQTLKQEFPDAHFKLWVCCGDNAAIAHDALRVGLNVRCNVSEVMRDKLRSVAMQQGVMILDKLPA